MTCSLFNVRLPHDSYEMDLDEKGLPRMDPKTKKAVSLKPCSFAAVMEGIELLTRRNNAAGISEVHFHCNATRGPGIGRH